MKFENSYVFDDLQPSHIVASLQNWPVKALNTNCEIPTEIKTIQSLFESFYKSHVPNGTQRKLIWLNHLSIVQVKLIYSSQVYNVLMTFLHASIILLFENVDELSYYDIEVCIKLFCS